MALLKFGVMLDWMLDGKVDGVIFENLTPWFPSLVLVSP